MFYKLNLFSNIEMLHVSLTHGGSEYTTTFDASNSVERSTVTIIELIVIF